MRYDGQFADGEREWESGASRSERDRLHGVEEEDEEEENPQIPEEALEEASGREEEEETDVRFTEDAMKEEEVEGRGGRVHQGAEGYH